MTTIDVTCPSCGAVSYFEELSRDASAFCRVCDFPLFWVRSTYALAGNAGGETGLRRLPGTAGRVAVATIDCPACTEPNPAVNRICIRCGADLRPPPPAPAPPPLPPAPIVQAPPPPPPPPKPARWPWIVLGLLALIAVVVLIVLLV